MATSSTALESVFGAMPKHWGFSGITETYRTSPTETINPKNNTLPEGYVAVVTGGASGIGEYIARSYIEAKARSVVITGRRTALLEETKGKLEKLAAELGQKTKVTICPGDAERQEAYIKIRELVEKEHDGRLDALVCNAGPGTTDPATWTPKIHKQDVESWDSMIRVNLCGPYYAAKHLIPLMLNPQSQGKTIVNIVSGAAHMTSGMPPIAYPIGKLGSTRLAQNLSEAYAEEGIQAFALHPGGVLTPASSTMPKEMQALLTDDINLCGNLCVWLSKNRPDWLNGRYLSVNWDIDELAAQKDEIVAKEKFKFTMDI